MSFINEISGPLLLKLAQSSGETTSTSSSISGNGTGASSDGANVNINQGLLVGRDQFTQSVLRLNSAQGTLQITENLVMRLVQLGQELHSLAKESQDSQTATDERAAFELDFRTLLREYDQVLNEGDVGEDDLLSVSDLEDVLSQAGIDTHLATRLSEAFQHLGGRNLYLGTENITLDDQTVVDPLDLSVDTQENAIRAEEAFESFNRVLTDELEALQTVMREIHGALTFSLEAAYAFADFSGRSLNPDQADQIATQLVSTIKNNASDPEIAPHSDLDRLLIANLLG